jgi:hypothetical protein
MLGGQSWCWSLGAAYMMDNSYIELNGGYDFNSADFDFGIGGGAANTTGPTTVSDDGPDVGDI